jgi:hypothetical protein
MDITRYTTTRHQCAAMAPHSAWRLIRAVASSVDILAPSFSLRLSSVWTRERDLP